MTERKPTQAEIIARALEFVLVSPNVSDSNGEAANLVDTTQNLARALWSTAPFEQRRDGNKTAADALFALADGVNAVADQLARIASALEAR